MHPKLPVALLCTALSLPLATAAQRPAAADPAAPVPPLKYESAFSAYRPYQDPPVRNWAEVNEEVAKAGGHIGIFGGAGPAPHGAPKAPTQSPLGEGQPPVRGAPQAPAGKPHQH